MGLQPGHVVWVLHAIVPHAVRKEQVRPSPSLVDAVALVPDVSKRCDRRRHCWLLHVLRFCRQFL